MKASKFSRVAFAIVLLASFSVSSQAARGGKNNGSDPSGGYLDAVFIVDSLSPSIPPVASNSADSKGQVVWYGQMDLGAFEGRWDSGGACVHDGGLREGIIVMYPQSSTNPAAAELIFWFSAELESGDAVTYLLTMRGRFDEPLNWPPSVDDPQTTVTLDDWEFAAENRKAQRQDCAGSSDYPAGPWTVTVTRVP